jgi:hypothetical protein
MISKSYIEMPSARRKVKPPQHLRPDINLMACQPPSGNRTDKSGPRQKTQGPPSSVDSQHPPYPPGTLPPLLRVPVEIRREILRYLLPGPKKQFQFYAECESAIVGSKWNRNPASRENHALAILRTNHQLYYEGLSLLYSENLFHFISLNYLPVLDFIRQLSPAAKSHVRRVRITLLPDCQERLTHNHDRLCSVLHDVLPGLTTLRADPWIWL